MLEWVGHCVGAVVGRVVVGKRGGDARIEWVTGEPKDRVIPRELSADNGRGDAGGNCGSEGRVEDLVLKIHNLRGPRSNREGEKLVFL